MGRWIDLYCRVLKVVVALCLAAMVVLVFTNVVLRYAFNSGIATSEELSRWLLVWLTFLGAIVAYSPALKHALLGVPEDLLESKGAVSPEVAIAMAQGVLTFHDSAPASGISVGLFFYSSGLVFGISAAVILLYDLARVLAGAATEEDLISVRESDEHT